MHRILALPLVIAGTLVPAIAASGAGAVEVPLTTTTTTTTAPGDTATEDVTTTTEPGETATEDLEAGETESPGSLVDPGALSISVPAAADLAATPVGSGGLSGALGAVTVTDTRSGAVAGWTAFVSASDFVTGGGTPHEIIPRAGVAYRSGPATATQGAAMFGPGQPDGVPAAPLDVPRMAFSALTGTGGTSATWVPTVVVSVPPSAVVGQYRGTITHSVA